jgi:hypothetical protein
MTITLLYHTPTERESSSESLVAGSWQKRSVGQKLLVFLGHKNARRIFFSFIHSATVSASSYACFQHWCVTATESSTSPPAHPTRACPRSKKDD